MVHVSMCSEKKIWIVLYLNTLIIEDALAVPLHYIVLVKTTKIYMTCSYYRQLENVSSLNESGSMFI